MVPVAALVLGGVALHVPTRAPATPRPIMESHSIRVDRKLTLAVEAPASVAPGATIKVAGAVRVQGKKPRKVVLSEKAGGAWKKLYAGKSAKNGSYGFKVKAGAQERTRTFRVTAPKLGKLAKVREQFKVVVRVPTPRTPPEPPIPDPTDVPTDDGTPEPATPSPEPAPAGSPTDWVWGNPGGVRWNPCATITWTYRPSGEPYAAFADAQRAIERVAERTGLTFLHTASSGADITIRWANARVDPDLAGSIVGYARWFANVVRNKDVKYKIVEADVVLDREHKLRAGHHVSGDPSWGQVMTHEVIHSMGLSHARGEQQIMYPSVHSLNHRFGAGDIAGLAAVGASHGCL